MRRYGQAHENDSIGNIDGEKAKKQAENLFVCYKPLLHTTTAALHVPRATAINKSSLGKTLMQTMGEREL